MVRRLRPHLTYANVVATLCLFIVLGGTGYAASKISGKRIKSRSIAQRALKDRTIGRRKIRAHTLTGAQIRADSLGNAEIANGSLEAAHAGSADRATRATSAARADTAGHADSADTANTANSATSATSADDATKLGGTAAGEYRTFDGTLPSGKSESGDFGIRALAPANATGFLDQSVTFTTPLATRIPGAKIVYTKLPTTDPTNCPGPGQAATGFLCIYESNSGGATSPDIFAFENQNAQNESGNFGFNIEWDTNSVNPFAVGTYTVTAP